jgi:hypothetical protein
MKNKIKFSHEYVKLPYLDMEVTLISVQRIKDFQSFATKCDGFILYDTTYFGDNEYQVYDLSKLKDALILTFYYEFRFQDIRDVRGVCFTTIRRWTPNKEKYYNEKIGEKFYTIYTGNEKM